MDNNVVVLENEIGNTSPETIARLQNAVAFIAEKTASSILAYIDDTEVVEGKGAKVPVIMSGSPNEICDMLEGILSGITYVLEEESGAVLPEEQEEFRVASGLAFFVFNYLNTLPELRKQVAAALLAHAVENSLSGELNEPTSPAEPEQVH